MNQAGCRIDARSWLGQGVTFDRFHCRRHEAAGKADLKMIGTVGRVLMGSYR